MKKNINYITEKILKITAWTVSITAITQLALSQFTIRISRLSASDHTGISLFAFILLGLVTVFAVSRMKEGFASRLFAVIVNFTTALAAAWYLSILLTDEVFLRSIFSATNTRIYNEISGAQITEPLSAGGKIAASLPVAAVITGAAIHCLAGLTILTVSIMSILNKDKNPNEKRRLAEGEKT